MTSLKFWLAVSLLVIMTTAILCRLWKILNKDDEDDEILGI